LIDNLLLLPGSPDKLALFKGSLLSIRCPPSVFQDALHQREVIAKAHIKPYIL
jgi:hypothetical protein